MGFEQGRFSGLCGVYAIMNALAILFPRRIDDETGEGLFAAVLEAYPGPVRDLVIDGCEGPEIGPMLDGALAWTRAQGWPAWFWQAEHPAMSECPETLPFQEGRPARGGIAEAMFREIEHAASSETAEAFWTRMRTHLAGSRASVIVGFGEDDRPGSRYEPHWTCVEEIGRRTIHLKDSSIYRRVLRSETGVRPESRWAIEDAFVLKRTA